MNSFELEIKSHNISNEVDKFIQISMQGEEVQLPILCQLSKNLIDIPVRHSSIKMLKCIFDLKSLLEYCKVTNNYNQLFICPVCYNKTYLQNFGVDTNLYHTLEAFKLFKIQYRRKYANKYIDESLLFYSSQETYSFYQCKVKDGKKETQYEKVIIPGTSAILGISKRHQFNDDQQKPQNKKISENIAFTIQKLSHYLSRKIYKISKERKISMSQLYQLIEPKKSQISLLFRNSMKLISLGKKSLKSDFIFALKKIYHDNNKNKFISLLIVYYVFYDVWHEYKLEIQNNPMNILGQQLYIKEFECGSEHYLYIIGGRDSEQFTQSSQFLRIRIPSNPFQQKEAKVEILPNLPVEGYNFMGTTYQGKVYVFYGQKQFIDEEKCIQNQLLNTAYAYKNNKWVEIKLQLENRFDGSFFVCQDQIFDKLVIFFGGQTCDPKGRINSVVQEQVKIQIFSCKEEILLGNKLKFFNLKFSNNPEESYQQKVLCSPLFSCPYYGRNQLILSGEYLKKPFQGEIKKGKREIFNLDWENGTLKLNEIFSFEPPEYFLTKVREYGKKESAFQPVDDLEGCVAYGYFYAIFHSLSEKNTESYSRSITQLLRIDLTNTQFRVHQYQDNNKSVEKSKKLTERFENRENLNIL
ncbi:unnamed protein product [Paramecium sonneborni]|uniref:Uncharacterized protein n=1 Tax=Paramecium sonneborni TaxID=65129 RepID=A0A8S1NF10_9CILI|nr:unnamed protein product [Paramecium sonneborni]